MDTDTVPTLFVIQEGIYCMPTTDYYFTNIQPEPIIASPNRRKHSEQTAQQAATKDPVSQQTHPLQPGKTRVYPSMLADKQVPVCKQLFLNSFLCKMLLPVLLFRGVRWFGEWL